MEGVGYWHYIACLSVYRIAGNFRGVSNFVVKIPVTKFPTHEYLTVCVCACAVSRAHEY